MTLPVIIPNTINKTIQGERLLAASNELILISVAPLVAEISPKSSVVSSSKISITSSTVTIPNNRLCLEMTGTANKSYFCIVSPTSSWSKSSWTDTTLVPLISEIYVLVSAIIKSRRETTPTNSCCSSTTYK